MVKNNLVLRNGILIGTIAGIVFGLLVKWTEILTGKLIYSLLLNIDFIPFFGSILWGELMEFVFHLIFSILLTILFVWINTRFPISKFIDYLSRAFLFIIPVIPLYFLLSSLSIRDVAKLTDWVAFSYWVITHLFFSLFIAYGNWILQKSK